ncbi:hypothetical protein [Deinococcus hopiensis]|uniref:Outer membrane protein beta-barrel domain-containing protein n=1 Tax=Deinococcus hopiensis KR-140 TaxID=695939 RepID=A0A1W1V7C5_9DEIO|nr:hypothetical protein [Deinococcus hopiensis]SMB89262.1 hypothetical protein SAMN00790413_00339 [Deinococcus hopiensis KR-140]
MKKALFALTLSLGLSSAAQAAPSVYLGVRAMAESPVNVGVGAQVTYDVGSYAVRLGLNAKSILGFTLGFGGDVAALFPLSGNTETAGRVLVGAGVDVERHNGALTVVRPHVLLNGEYRLARFFSVFGEASVGYALLNSSYDAVGFLSPGLRVGLNFR